MGRRFAKMLAKYSSERDEQTRELEGAHRQGALRAAVQHVARAQCHDGGADAGGAHADQERVLAREALERLQRELAALRQLARAVVGLRRLRGVRATIGALGGGAAFVEPLFS